MTPPANDTTHRITLIPGDGIGPECVTATQRIIEAAGAHIEWETCDAGAEVFKKGIASGVPQETIDSIQRTRVALKGPLMTPVGHGEKSANVTLRKLFETYANIRPVREIPGMRTPYSGRGIDLVVVRENVEDLYAGIEHMQTPGVAQTLKVISRKGCDKIVRLAFELARAEGRREVACATKANIMKMTEGMLKRSFEAIAPEYDDLETWHVIVDNCAHQLVKLPEQYGVLVMTNMNGDILSDLSSALIGGLGFAPSANLGATTSIFEAVHGSAPKYAGKNCINPSAVLMSSLMMLRHLGLFDEAAAIEHAMLVTLEERKVVTRDVVGDELAATTTAYTDEIIKNLGRRSEHFQVRDYKPLKFHEFPSSPAYVEATQRRVAGVDVFVESLLTPEKLGADLERLAENTALRLKVISNRGTRVWPPTGTHTDNIDAWQCRFMLRDDAGDLADADLMDLLARINTHHGWTHLEKLHVFDGEPGFTRSQGED